MHSYEHFNNVLKPKHERMIIRHDNEHFVDNIFVVADCTAGKDSQGRFIVGKIFVVRTSTTKTKSILSPELPAIRYCTNNNSHTCRYVIRYPGKTILILISYLKFFSLTTYNYVHAYVNIQ